MNFVILVHVQVKYIINVHVQYNVCTYFSSLSCSVIRFRLVFVGGTYCYSNVPMSETSTLYVKLYSVYIYM